jgi:hypothetical protein
MRKIGFVLAVAMVLSSQSDAGIWGGWIAGGTACNAGNVNVVENGNTLSVLFDEFGVFMPEGDVGDGMSIRRSCTFRIQLTPPSGFYLAGFKQVYSGGVIKSSRSSAQLNVRYNVGSAVGTPLPIVFREGQVIRPEDSQSMFTRTYDNNLLVANCGGNTVYGLNMSLTATRRNYREHIVGGLDSVDADFSQKVILIPDFQLCPRR